MPPLNNSTESRLKNWLKHTSHGLLLSGQPNHNQAEVSKWLGLQLAPLANNIIIDDESSIGVDQIRQLIKLASQHKQASEKAVFVIPYAGKLTIEAQNALLKLLEEPPSGTFLILACSIDGDLLMTVKSRLTTIEVKPLDEKQYFAANSSLDKKEIVKNWNLNRGLIVPQQQSQESINFAKIFVQATVYERLKMASEISKDRDKIRSLVTNLFPVYSYLIHSALLKDNKKHLKTLINKQQAVLEADRLLSTNVNSKAIVAHLCTAL